MAVVGQDARDEDEPKPAIIVLIIKAIQAKAAATAGAAARADGHHTPDDQDPVDLAAAPNTGAARAAVDDAEVPSQCV